MTRLQKKQTQKRICIICEGTEEYAYLSRIRELGVWSNIYQVDLVNADGNGNLPARYQDKYQNDSYDLVLVFCDTDRKPYEQYNDIKKKIDTFHGIDGISNQLVIFGNPCTMQIIISHWTDTVLTSPSKKKNAPLILECTGIENYDAHREQIESLVSLITDDNYSKMKEKMMTITQKDTITPSSNFGVLMQRLETNDYDWIDDINDQLLLE